MKKINILFILISLFIGLIFFSSPSVNAADNDKCSASFLTFPTWYKGLTRDDGSVDKCELKPIGDPRVDSKSIELKSFIFSVVLNVIEILLVIIRYISIIFILYGGFQYLTSGGNADNIKKAKSTITNAIIGLVVSISAVVVVNLITGLWS
jgi:hypothetical protein